MQLGFSPKHFLFALTKLFIFIPCSTKGHQRKKKHAHSPNGLAKKWQAVISPNLQLLK